MSNHQKDIVIIGATGLIGQHLVSHLMSTGYYPIVVTRNISKGKKLFGESVQVVFWDGIDASSLTEIINGSKGVVNLAGESIATRWTKKKKETILKSRVNTTNTIVHAIKGCSHPPEVFIQASAIGYYPYDLIEQVDENGMVGNGFLSQVVMQWEKAADKVEDKSRLVIIRTGIVLSADGGFLDKILPPIKMFFGGWFGSGTQMLSWIHIDDHVNAIQFLIENNTVKGIFNLVSIEPLTYKQFVKQIGKNLKRPIWAPIPTFVVRLIFGQMANEVILSSQNVLPQRLLALGFKFKFIRIEGALKDLLHKK
jgi:uncharacterized protein (TIGR01777 family)